MWGGFWGTSQEQLATEDTKGESVVAAEERWEMAWASVSGKQVASLGRDSEREAGSAM